MGFTFLAEQAYQPKHAAPPRFLRSTSAVPKRQRGWLFRRKPTDNGYVLSPGTQRSRFVTGRPEPAIADDWIRFRPFTAVTSLTKTMSGPTSRTQPLPRIIWDRP